MIYLLIISTLGKERGNSNRENEELSWKVSVKVPCVYVCLSSGDLIFSIKVSSFFTYCWVIHTSVLSFPCGLMVHYEGGLKSFRPSLHETRTSSRWVGTRTEAGITATRV